MKNNKIISNDFFRNLLEIIKKNNNKCLVQDSIK